MNLRGAGAGFGLARGIYHAGRSDDLRSAIAWLEHRAPGSPIALAGFSLGANLALKLAAEATDRPVAGLDCVLAANPPIDLSACAAAMRRPENRLYDWNFVRWLRAEVTRLHRVFPELGPPDLRRVHSVYEFDDRYTAPRNGFASALDYYARSSALPLIPQIELPGLVIHAADDPFVPVAPFHGAHFPANLTLELVRQGGHLGYISRLPWQGDRRWLETRMAVWLAGRWGISTVPLDFGSSSRQWARANMGACKGDA
jgi:predicted alpha/beta-fold hydrolase